MQKELMNTLRDHLQIPESYSDKMIELNLPFLFVSSEKLALQWVAHIEAHYEVDIPDEKIDVFFFSSLNQMTATILQFQ